MALSCIFTAFSSIYLQKYDNLKVKFTSKLLLVSLSVETKTWELNIFCLVTQFQHL